MDLRQTETNLKPTEEALTSWKESGAFLQRNEATARRWEREEGLPVHRQSHKARASVYAYPSEIDAWRASRKAVPEPPPPRPLWKMPAFALTMAMALVMVGNGLRPQRAEAQGSPLQPRPVWTGAGVNANGSVSADGRWLSYVDQTTGDLALRNLQSGETRKLTVTTNQDGSWRDFAVKSEISPDGKMVAYFWFRDSAPGELRVIPISGGSPKTILSNADFKDIRPVGWSADGKSVVVDIQRVDQTRQFALASLDGGPLKVLKSLPWTATSKVSVSPDGRFIAYDAPVGQNPRRDVYVLSVDGTQEASIEANASDEAVVGWASDGGSILYASDRTGSQGLWQSAIVNGRVAGEPSLIKRDTGQIRSLGITSAGALYYGFAAGLREVYVVDIDPKTLKPTGTPQMVAKRFLGSNAGADWSPDGKYIAYISARSPGPNVITIHSLADGTERDIAPDLPYLPNYPPLRWSRDGKSVVVRGRDRGGLEAQYTVDLQTAKASPILEDAQPYSPDGSTAYGFQNGMKLVAKRGASTTVLYTGRYYTGVFSLSPDGKTLAVIDSDGAGKPEELLLVPTSGGTPRKLLQEPLIGGSVMLQWTPESDAILFAKPGSPDGVDLWRVDVRTGQQSFVSAYPAIAGAFGAGRLSPDGRQLSYMSGKPQLEIWALETAVAR